MPRTPIPLPPQELLRRLFSYDSLSGELRHNNNPELGPSRNARFAGKLAGYTNPKGYVQVCVDGRLFLAHRVIWKMMTGDDPIEVDHKDSHPINNKWDNLRACTHAENGRNQRPRFYKKLPLGVYLTRQGKFQAKLCGNGVTLALGVFDHPDDAARAYDKAAMENYGDFAKLNFPKDCQ